MVGSKRLFENGSRFGGIAKRGLAAAGSEKARRQVDLDGSSFDAPAAHATGDDTVGSLEQRNGRTPVEKDSQGVQPCGDAEFVASGYGLLAFERPPVILDSPGPVAGAGA